MNPNVSLVYHNGRIFPFDDIHFRLGPRRRARYSKGDSDGTRCVPTPFRHTRQSLNSQPDKLKYSKFDTPEDLAAFSQKFDEGVKKVFSSSNALTDQFVKFGSPRDNDPNCGIKSGRLSLTG